MRESWTERRDRLQTKTRRTRLNRLCHTGPFAESVAWSLTENTHVEPKKRAAKDPAKLVQLRILLEVPVNLP